VLVDPANYEPFGFQRLIYILSSINYLYNPVFLVLALALIVVGWRIVPTGLKVYTFMLLTAPTLFAPPDNPLVSMPRFILVAFPLFIVLGMLLKDRKLLAGWLFVSIGVSVIFTALFVGWFFAA
jgi:hypothetical protein